VTASAMPVTLARVRSQAPGQGGAHGHMVAEGARIAVKLRARR